MQSKSFFQYLIFICAFIVSGFCFAQDPDPADMDAMNQGDMNQAAGNSGNGQDFKVQLIIEGCQFTGGTDGMGNVEVTKKSGSKKIQIEVLNAEGYTIAPIEFSGVGADQMKATGGGNSNKFNIHNKNTGPADVYYGLNLTRITTGEIVNCDPKIVNK